ncbi:SDR family NAD(P)-dependent oxidoreductase [Streptomyces sp. NPDC087843]|uniref:SDR family NAD(P)-dependent oxidoreductase n=1 Tax=Streptomyces sp. NPDC087843 TaxID=3365804 RepID=UPI00381C2737
MKGPFGMTGQTALVTGSTAGMGLEIARGLAHVGARTVISSHDDADLEAARARLGSEGVDVGGIVCDISDAASARSLAERAFQRFGRIDSLIVHAGGFTPYGPLAEAGRQDVERAFSTTVFNNLELIQNFLPRLAGAGGGSVVVTSSIASVRASPILGVYGAAKAALNSLVRNIAAEWGDRGVRANLIAPATVRTRFSEVLWSDPLREEAAGHKTALGRIAEPAEVVGAVLLFASPAGSYITGQTLLIDGGRSVL